MTSNSASAPALPAGPPGQRARTSGTPAGGPRTRSSACLRQEGAHSSAGQFIPSFQKPCCRVQGSAEHNRRKQLLDNDLKKDGAIRNQIVPTSQNIADSTAAPEQITNAPDSSARARPSSTGVSRAAKKLARKATPPRRMAPYVGTCPEADRTRRPLMSGTASASATWDDRHAPAER